MTNLTPATLKSVLGWLGLSPGWFANRCNTTMRTVVRWFDGDNPIPDTAVKEFLKIWQFAAIVADEMQQEAEYDHNGAILLYTFRTDKEFWEAAGTDEYPASWHRSLTVRVSERFSPNEVRIEYGH